MRFLAIKFKIQLCFCNGKSVTTLVRLIRLASLVCWIIYICFVSRDSSSI